MSKQYDRLLLKGLGIVEGLINTIYIVSLKGRT